MNISNLFKIYIIKAFVESTIGILSNSIGTILCILGHFAIVYCVYASATLITHTKASRSEEEYFNFGSISINKHCI